MKTKSIIVSTFVMFGLISTPLLAADKVNRKLLARGHYLVSTSGCNDCHTPGYAESGGKIKESKWLEGSSIGFQGPWGTTYPANLRLLMSQLSLKQWMKLAHTPMRPPMPWFNLHHMTDADLHAIYAYVRKLGPAGKPAPKYAGPGVAVDTPYYVFVPRNLPQTARAGK